MLSKHLVVVGLASNLLKAPRSKSSLFYHITGVLFILPSKMPGFINVLLAFY